MRDFGEADKKKKRARIEMPENPAGLSAEVLARLADAIRASLKEGNLPCGSAFRISRDAGVPKIAVGELTDRLGLRVTNCQLGCFKVDKAVHDNVGAENVDETVLSRLETLKKENALTCTAVFELAHEMRLPPMAVANVANARSLKLHGCQLGCF